jgi:beta,beta-carotene 9',10'-dioxygenase
MSDKLKRGFTTLDREIEVARLPINGKLPPWLSGTLVRNGPAQFEVGAQKYRHWFDGLAMLHRFTFAGGAVSYANKFLRSRAFRDAKATDKIAYGEFATDPCRSMFQRVATLFSPAAFGGNANVNVTQMADRFIAMTETPLPIAFAPQTLETLGVFDYGADKLPGQVTTAHPHFDYASKSAINYVTEFSRRSKYHFYRLPPGQQRRQLIATIPVEQPSYMHSFGMTKNYVLLAEFPLVVNPLRLMLGGKPFIENYKWKPERGTGFITLSKRDRGVRTQDAEAFFAFHHVNAFERDGDIFVDIAAYPDDGVISDFYLDHLRTGHPIPRGQLRRYRLPGNSLSADYEVLSLVPIELPRINYARYNTMDYRFVYGVSNRPDRPCDFFNQLVKIDVSNRTHVVWYEDDCEVGEPVFVATPGGTRAEDDGTILSVVLNTNTGTSFLLVLDASAFSEIARAQVPHHIPHGFHGQYFAI